MANIRIVMCQLESMVHTYVRMYVHTHKFVHVVQSFVKGHRKSGVISIKHSRDTYN